MAAFLPSQQKQKSSRKQAAMTMIVVMLFGAVPANAMQAASSSSRNSYASHSSSFATATIAAVAAGSALLSAQPAAVSNAQAETGTWLRTLAKPGERPKPQPRPPQSIQPAQSNANISTMPQAAPNHGLQSQAKPAPSSSARLSSIKKKIFMTQADLDSMYVARSRHDAIVHELNQKVSELEDTVEQIRLKLELSQRENGTLRDQVLQAKTAHTHMKTGLSYSSIWQYRRDTFGNMTEPVKLAVIASELASMWKANQNQVVPQEEETKHDESFEEPDSDDEKEAPSSDERAVSGGKSECVDVIK